MRLAGLVIAALAALTTLSVVSPASAQQSAAAPESYDAEYFARFNPTNAADMVRQVPGFVVDEGDNVRGFGGAASNVLINGERPSTKERITDLLRRISADSVIRIDVVTSATGDLDMRGQTKVANVIVERDALERAPINWRVFARHHQGGRVTGEIQANTVTSFLGGDLTLGFTGGQRGLGGPGNGTSVVSGRLYLGGGGQETHRGVQYNESIAVEPSAEFERRFDWGALRLNAGWSGCCGSGRSTYEVFVPDFSGVFDERQEMRYESDASDFTFGGDIERSLGQGASAKLIFVNERGESSTERLFEFYDGTGGFISSTLVDSEQSDGESIVRGQINWRWGENHSIETALEGAYNFLDSTRMITANGVLDVTPPGSDTIVEELRGEIQVSDVWTVSPALTIEPGMTVEFSQIEQEVRDVAPARFVERTFTYPKPSLAATWRPADGRQFRFSLERRVAQLDFDDFVSSFDVINDLTLSGNTQLEPERTWALNGAYETVIWDGGVLTLSASHDWVEAVQDSVCVPGDPNLMTPCVDQSDSADGPGNIGDGRRWSIGAAASLPLERFGVEGGRLDIDLRSGSSTVVDPVTGESREFSDEFTDNWSTSFRQDLAAHEMSWGVSASGGGGATAFRLNETFRRQRVGTALGVFVETTRFFGT
ncbi:MAG: hypothetical protein PVI23_10915, partial [Maricaulaceae bacterium]